MTFFIHLPFSPSKSWRNKTCCFGLMLIFRIGYLGVIFDFNFQTFQYLCNSYVPKENDCTRKNIVKYVRLVN